VAMLDTTVLIDLARSPARPAHGLARAAIQRLLNSGQMLFTSRINEAEFRVGPEVCTDRQKELDRVERVLAAFIILEFNSDAARRYATIKGVMMKKGRPVGDCDAMVAAVALAHAQILITRNPRHFIDVPGLLVQSY